MEQKAGIKSEQLNLEGAKGFERTKNSESTRHNQQVGRSRRKRTVYSTEQLDKLERVFLWERYPGVAVRQELADQLGISESCVQVWFQNRRSRWRKGENNRQPNKTCNRVAGRIWHPHLIQNHCTWQVKSYRTLSTPETTSHPIACASFTPVHTQMQSQMPLHGVGCKSEDEKTIQVKEERSLDEMLGAKGLLCIGDNSNQTFSAFQPFNRLL